MTKRPPKPKPAKPPTHERLKAAWYRHPVAIISGVLAFLGAAVSATPAIQWAVGYYQTSSDAKEQEIRLHAEIEAHKIVERRTNAWAMVQDLRRDTVLSRNRVNDCNLLRERTSGLTTLEKNVCDQYRDDLEQATKKYNEAVQQAQALSKEK